MFLSLSLSWLRSRFGPLQEVLEATERLFQPSLGKEATAEGEDAGGGIHTMIAKVPALHFLSPAHLAVVC